MTKGDVIGVFDEVGSVWEEKNKWIYKIQGNDNKVIGILEKYVKSYMKILDVGCGSGKLLRQLRQKNITLDLTGIEPSSKMQEFQNKFGRSICIIQDDIEECSLDGKYDIIILKQVLHHIVDKAQVIKKLANMLSEKGILLIMVPFEEYQNSVIEYQEHDLLGRFDHETIFQLCDQAKLVVKEIDISKANIIFQNQYCYFKFMQSIGSLQKIFGYREDEYRPVEEFIEIFKRLFNMPEAINIDGVYSYYVLECERKNESKYNEELEKAFDTWAETYEDEVCGKLINRGYSYQELGKIIANQVETKSKVPEILELGVGTGILGKYVFEALKGKVSLSGIDISAEMLKNAAKKNVYQMLYKSSADEYNFDKVYEYIYTAFMFHSVKKKQIMLENIRMSMKEMCKLIIIDLVPKEDVIGQQLEHSKKYEYGAPAEYMTLRQLIDLYNTIGFKVTYTQLGICKDYTHYMFVLTKK